MKRTLAGLCLGCLLALGTAWAADGPVRSEVLAKTSRSWNGSLLPEFPRGTPEVTILRIQIAPGAQLPAHKHPVINSGLLTKGELTVVTEDNAVLHLKAGEPIVEVVDRWHYGKNEGTEPAEIVVFYFGEAGSPLSVLKPGADGGH